MALNFEEGKTYLAARIVISGAAGDGQPTSYDDVRLRFTTGWVHVAEVHNGGIVLPRERVILVEGLANIPQPPPARIR